MGRPYLTGRSRFRVHTRLFRAPLMVLQVEWKQDAYMSTAPADGYWEETTVQFPTTLWWADARMEDTPSRILEGNVV